MICALLIFKTPDLPAPLAQLSPWLDWVGVPQDALFSRLAAQQHRRLIKTHTPLDGIPLSSEVTYLVVARHPLDAAVSLYHQGDNLNRERIRELTGQPDPHQPLTPRLPLFQWLPAWINRDVDPREKLDSLPGHMLHLTDAWMRRDAANVELVHYADLSVDLEGQMRRLAARLDIAVSEPVWPDLVAAARFPAMRHRADRLAPDPNGVLKDPAAFFRHGRTGAHREHLTPDQLADYRAQTGELAPRELLRWLHREDIDAAPTAAKRRSYP